MIKYTTVSSYSRRLRIGGRFAFVLLSFVLVNSLILLAGGGSVWNERTGREYGSIQDAIATSRPNDSILVGAGRYDESLVIRHSLTLRTDRGSGKRALIVPSGGYPAISIINPPNGSEVTIDGFEMEVDVPNSYAILDEVADFTLTNCVVRGTGRGLAVKTYLPSGVKILSNTFLDFDKGIAVENAGSEPVYDVVISDNHFEAFPNSPILLTYCPDAVIDSNTMANSNDVGRYNRSIGMTLHNCPGAQIRNNMICYHHLGVFLVSSDNALIQSNVVNMDMETQGAGIDVYNSAYINVIGNKIEEVAYAMVFNEAYRARVFDNWMADSEYGLQNGTFEDPTYILDATNNWWGASDGPSFEGSGTGVPVNRNVIFDPWLDEQPKIKEDKECPR